MVALNNSAAVLQILVPYPLTLTHDMNTLQHITAYIDAQPDRKRSDLQTLHERIRRLMPDARLWFLDGKDDTGRTIANPNIGYGVQTKTYANGTTKEFYQIGLSANTTGISVYIMGLTDKSYLATTYGHDIGKATVTGYCIKFRSLDNINLDILEAAIRDGIQQT